jgi:hypothetical protein
MHPKYRTGDALVQVEYHHQRVLGNISTDAGDVQAPRVDALATRWRVLAARLDDGVCGY